MRLFIAIDLPEEVKKELARLQDNFPEGRLSKPKDFHITLKFLGEVDTGKAESLNAKLSSVKFAKIRASVSGIGFFPNEKSIRVIWVGVKPEEQIIQLQKDIDILIGNDFPDDHKFSPHITLARVKYADDTKKFSEAIKKLKIQKHDFEISSFKLKKSTLSSNGPVYEDVEDYPVALS